MCRSQRTCRPTLMPWASKRSLNCCTGIPVSKNTKLPCVAVCCRPSSSSFACTRARSPRITSRVVFRNAVVVVARERCSNARRVGPHECKIGKALCHRCRRDRVADAQTRKSVDLRERAQHDQVGAACARDATMLLGRALIDEVDDRPRRRSRSSSRAPNCTNASSASRRHGGASRVVRVADVDQGVVRSVTAARIAARS